MTKPGKPLTSQEIRRQRQQEAFTGREDHLDLFRRQLALAGDDPQRRFVLSIHGQGGVGKTTLLRQFRRVAGSERALIALTDHNERSVPETMARLAAELAESGGASATLAFSPFTERHATYLKRRGELEADPDAPRGLAGFVGHAAVRLGAKALRNTVPGSDLALDLIEGPLAEQAGLWAEFVSRKLGNRDEVRLVLEPAAVLTPLFVNGLNELAAAQRVVLLFDTYENTVAFLDNWLRDLHGGRHGDTAADLTLVVAGRDELDRNDWAEFTDEIARLSLDPFTEDEARAYLARKNVSHEKVIEVILRLSGRLPLLLATLAAESPDDPAKVGDASGTAVERFLKWVDDPARRALALNAALPRRLNRDIVGLLGGDAAAFDWLIANPFIERRPDGWTCHSVVREQMLRYKRTESPAEWAALHTRLADHYRAAQDDLALPPDKGMDDENWRAADLEALYHRLCARPQPELAAALDGFVVALGTRWATAVARATTMTAAGEDSGHAPLLDWGRSLKRGLQAYDEGRYEDAAALFTRLIALNSPGIANQPVIWAYRGETYRQMGRYEEALADFTRAIELDPNDSWVIGSRGQTYQQMGRYEEALTDFTRAIELDPKLGWAIGSRGETYRQTKRYAEALTDFTRAIELDPDYGWAIGSRGETYRQMGRYEEALADLNRAIELDPKLGWAIGRRGETYRLLKRYEEALADLNRAIELDPDYGWAIGSRGETYRQMGRYEEALADFTRAIELDPNDSWAIGSRGQTYRQMGRYEEALADFNRAIELDPNDSWYLYQRAITRRYLDAADSWRDDLTAAVAIATADHQKTPTDLQNLFNLALYCVAGGDAGRAEALYREGLAGQPAEGLRREAAADLEQYLALFPDDELAARLLARVTAPPAG